MEYKEIIENDYTACSNKIKIKEEAEDSNVENGECFISDLVLKIKTEPDSYDGEEMTAERSVDIVSLIEASSVTNYLQQNGTKDDVNEILGPGESPRLYIIPEDTCSADESDDAEASYRNKNTISLRSERYLISQEYEKTSSSENQIPSEQIKCVVCDKIICGNSAYKLHLLIHKDKNSYECRLCEKRFTQLENLKEHRKIHEGNKPYKCKHCEKSYSHQRTLIYHRKIHESNNIYKCDTCEKIFARQKSFRCHLKLHEGNSTHNCERTHNCEICQKKFTALGHLKRYQMIHEGIKPFKCDICDKSFNQIGNLKVHKLIHERKGIYKRS